jgi:hypothetical protein
MRVNFYFRKDAQLVQGATATSTNSGVGNLSVFQEGSTSIFNIIVNCSCSCRWKCYLQQEILLLG